VAKRIEGTPLDAKLGFALLKDRRVPMRSKLAALALGGGITAALIALEVPFEMVLAALAVGLIPDVMIDSLEGVLGPILFGCLILPHLAPAELVQQIRLERAGLAGGAVIDVESTDPTDRPDPNPTSEIRYAR
jgi:hypothetical protein